MSTIALSGNDTQIINGRVLSDLADGDVGTVTFPNDTMNVKTGKNGNSLFGFNASGQQAEQSIRVIRGSADDQFLNGLQIQQNLEPQNFAPMTGEFVKQVGNGSTLKNDTYIQSGGVFVRNIDAKSNVEGDTDQSVAVYRLKWSKVIRVIT